MKKLIALVLFFLAFAAVAEDTPPDYAREKKWADEILPNVVVGDAVYLTTKSGIKFLSLLTEAKDAKAAVVLVHGRGWHPDYEVVGPLRSACYRLRQNLLTTNRYFRKR
jgi:hypothetical protein